MDSTHKKILSFIIIGIIGVAAVIAIILSQDDNESAEVKYTNRQMTARTLAVDPTNDSIIYIGIEEYGIFKSIDGGNTWQKISNGIKTDDGRYQEFREIQIHPTNPNSLVVIMSGCPGTLSYECSKNNGLYISEDGGQKWVQKVSADMNIAMYNLAVHPTTKNIMYVSVNGGKYSQEPEKNLYFNTVGIIYKTTDNGTTWTELPSGFNKTEDPNLGCTGLAINPENYSIIFASHYGRQAYPSTELSNHQFGILRSDNEGQSWYQINSGLPTDSRGLAIHRMEISKSSPLRMLAYNAAEQLYYSPNGTSWSRVEGGDYNLVFNFHPTNSSLVMGYNYGVGSVSISHDGGQTFQYRSQLPTNPRISDFEFSYQNPQIVYACGYNGTVYRSNDQGLTWTKILDGVASLNL